MKRTALIATPVVAFVAIAGIALAHRSKQGSEQPAAQRAKAVHGLKKSRPAPPADVIKTPIDPEAYARYRKAIEPAEHSLRAAQQRYRSGDLAGAERAARGAITLAAGLSPLPQASARRLIGRVRMRQGRYKEALGWLGADRHAAVADARLDLDAALCHARLGNPQTAKRFYSDRAVLQYSSIQPQDLPGTSNPQSLEASILLARGLDKFTTASGAQEALADLEAAGRLAPRNGLIPYYAGMSLVYMNRFAEAEPYFRRAAQYGRGRIAQDAQRRAAAYR